MMIQTQCNSHVRSLLRVKLLLNDTDDIVLSSCLDTLFDAFGKRNILEMLIKCSTEKQLNAMTDIIDEAVANSNQPGNHTHIRHNFDKISLRSISNIITFLSKDDINAFKLTSMRLGILCLEAMDATTDIYTADTPYYLFTSNMNERSALVEQWGKHKNNMIQTGALNCDNITQCGCIQRLLLIFTYINRWNVDDIDSILQIFNHLNGYSVQHFVNDLDHIRMCHDQHVNEKLFCKEINYCDWRKCAFQKRNGLLLNNDIDGEIFARFEFIQEAHLYLFHSVPLISDHTHCDQLQQSMQAYNDSNIHRSSRFVDSDTAAPETVPNDSNSDNETATDLEKATSPLFSYGNRFEYVRNKNCKKNSHYVGCAYQNLKKELLHDADKKFGIKQWNVLVNAANTLSETPYSKQLMSDNGKSISVGRIIAVRLYCSYGALASALKATYKESKTFSKSQRKQQHAKFAHWAKLLCTTCDLFGVAVVQKHAFYRGLNDLYIFRSGFSSKLYGPISTTRHLGVAAAFAGNGIILQIEKASFCSSAKFFECNAYSTYKAEGELLFDGHCNYLDVTAIKTNLGFTTFDTKPVLLLQALSSKCHINIAALLELAPFIVVKLCELLRRNKEKGDGDEKDYLLQTIDYYLTHLKRLEVKVKQTEDLIAVCTEMQQMDGCKELLSCLELICDADLFINKQLFSVDLFALIQIFPNTQSISFDLSRCGVKLSDNINGKLWRNFIGYMLQTKRDSARQQKKFRRIEFRKLTKQIFPTKVLKQIQHEIENCKWNVYTKRDNPEAILFLYGRNVNDKANNWIKL